MVEKWKRAAPPAAPQRMCPSSLSPNPECWVFSIRDQHSYFDLAFCLGTFTAEIAGFGAGAGGGLTESYTLENLQQNGGITMKKIPAPKKKPQFCQHDMTKNRKQYHINGQLTYRLLTLFRKALTALAILLIRTCHQNITKVSANQQFLHLTQNYMRFLLRYVSVLFGFNY